MAEAVKGNGDAGAPLPAAAPAEAPPLIINVQYIKDLSFENPRAPQSLTQPTAAPDVAINVDIKAHNLGPTVFEVVLTVNVDARAENQPLFLVELAYAAVVTVRNTSEAMLPGLILVETPRLIFPFARAIIADATRDGGFPPLMINPIDFSELLRRQPQAFAQVGGTRV
jgi:preprotein translocase subunit SecB